MEQPVRPGSRREMLATFPPQAKGNTTLPGRRRANKITENGEAIAAAAIEPTDPEIAHCTLTSWAFADGNVVAT